jgi:anti-sigma B factor antagonist
MYAYHHLGVWKHGDVIVVRFGEHRMLDELTVSKISDELYAVADRADCHNLLLNFSSVAGLSSVMLGKLLMLQKKMESKGGKLKICEVGSAIQEVFAETKLHQIFDIRDAELDALRAFT